MHFVVAAVPVLRRVRSGAADRVRVVRAIWPLRQSAGARGVHRRAASCHAAPRPLETGHDHCWCVLRLIMFIVITTVKLLTVE